MNYTDLVAAIESTTENTFETADVNRFIEQAERRIYNAVQFPSLRKNVTGALTSASPYLSAPTDFLSVYSLAAISALGAYTYLLNKDVNFIREAYPTPTSTGVPKYYAIFGPTTTSGPSPAPTTELSFIIGPTPDAGYNVELHYFYYPESIVTASTTWLGDNYAPVLLYGALVEAYIFMKGDEDVMKKYTDMYTSALAQAKRLGDGMERQDAYRSGQYRQGVT